MKKNVIIKVNNLCKTYIVGEQRVAVLKNINFEISQSEFVIIIGPSGSGKSTILYSLLGLEPPTEGKVTYFDEDIYTNTDEDFRANFRKKHIGMVYQQSNWIRSLSVKENVAFPMKLLGKDNESSYRRALDLLSQVNMEKWAEYLPSELSAGQQQRVALARALVNDPQIIIADEPTGNLDYQSGESIMNLLSGLSLNQKKTIVMVTHDLDYLRFAQTAIRIFDGEVAGFYGKKDYNKLLIDLKSKTGIRPAEDQIDKQK